MAKIEDMPITITADESFNRLVEMTPLIKRLIELLETHDPASVLTMRPLDPAATDALVANILEDAKKYLMVDYCSLEMFARALRERLGK